MCFTKIGFLITNLLALVMSLNIKFSLKYLAISSIFKDDEYEVSKRARAFSKAPSARPREVI